MAYWAQADLEARLSAQVVRQILDDNNDGTADSANIARLQADSDSYVNGFLRGIYDLSDVAASPPNEVKRLSLDVAEWMAIRRWPEYIRGDWQEKRKLTREELMDLREGRTRLDVESGVEPAANQGGTVILSEARADEDFPRMWDFGETGDF